MGKSLTVVHEISKPTFIYEKCSLSSLRAPVISSNKGMWWYVLCSSA